MFLVRVRCHWARCKTPNARVTVHSWARECMSQIKIDFLPEFLQARPLRWQIMIHYSETPACERRCIHPRIQCMHVWERCCIIQQRCSVTDDCCRAESSALPPWSVPISLFLPQAGHSFHAQKSPISPHAAHQTDECAPQASWTGLKSPKECAAQLIDFFFSILTLSLLYPVAFCPIASLAKK